jgi:hypothetical protein
VRVANRLAKFFECFLVKKPAFRFRSKIDVWNQRQVPLLVYVEPWANDYTLLPGEELEIVAFGGKQMPQFCIVESESACQVYCNETDDFQVFGNGIELQCGHQRQV